MHRRQLPAQSSHCDCSFYYRLLVKQTTDVEA